MCGDNNPMRRPEVAAKCAAANRGKTRSPEQVAKTRAAMNRPEVRAANSAAKMGNQYAKGANNAMKRPEVAAKNGVARTAPIGSKYVFSTGYVMVKASQEPGAPNYGWMMEHRHVMEQELGRPLDAEEVVHHIDGDKQNNVPENLQVFESNSAHSRHHAREQAT